MGDTGRQTDRQTYGRTDRYTDGPTVTAKQRERERERERGGEGVDGREGRGRMGKEVSDENNG